MEKKCTMHCKTAAAESEWEGGWVGGHRKADRSRERDREVSSRGVSGALFVH